MGYWNKEVPWYKEGEGGTWYEAYCSYNICQSLKRI